MSLEAGFAGATHVVFTSSGAGCLRQHIAELGAVPKILCLRDNLSIGPLDGAVQRRIDWLSGTLGEFKWREYVEQRASFRKDVAAITDKCCVWFSRKSALEYCGYLEWVSNHGGKIHRVIDADTPLGLINLLPEWLEHFSQAKSADPDQQSREAQDWSRLVSESAPVRKIENGRIVSAPIDCFDDLLLAKATLAWKSAALMVGEVLASDFKEIHQTGDLLLVNRLWTLVDTGRLEAKGDCASIQSVQMRIIV